MKKKITDGAIDCIQTDNIWNLMKQCFPLPCLRSYEDQRDLFHNKLYKYKTIEENNNLISFICYWEFDDFIFIEYFATDERFRGKGIGSKLLIDILNIGKKVILEVEVIKDTDPYSIKRVQFYERSGFKYNNYFYQQPPLTANTGFVDMRILSYPNVLQEDEFLKAKHILYKICYNYDPNATEC